MRWIAENIVEQMDGWHLLQRNDSLIAYNDKYAFRFKKERRLIRAVYAVHPDKHIPGKTFYIAPSITLQPDVMTVRRMVKMIEEKFLPKVYRKADEES